MVKLKFHAYDQPQEVKTLNPDGSNGCCRCGDKKPRITHLVTVGTDSKSPHLGEVSPAFEGLNQSNRRCHGWWCYWCEKCCKETGLLW